MYKCGLLTVSDSCFYDRVENISGKVLLKEISSLEIFNSYLTDTVPDEIDKIENVLTKWSDIDKLNLILTTGGTGFTPRDVTPEATLKVIERNASSISQVLLLKSLEFTKYAISSRGVSGIRRSTLIVNFPGSPKAVKECVEILSPVLTHLLDQLADKTDQIRMCHDPIKHPEKLKTTVSVSPRVVAGRPRSSPFPLLSVEEAQEIVFSKVCQLEDVPIPIADGIDLVVSEAVQARVNVPPYRASIKDGYAVLTADQTGQRRVISVSAAGDVDAHSCPCARAVSAGTCARVSTGARVPDGADAVVQVEDTRLVETRHEDGDEAIIEVLVAPSCPGQDIRSIGSDLSVGDPIIDAGHVLGPSEVGLLVMGGIRHLKCIRRPVVAVMSSGDELVNHDSEDRSITDGIIDCNRPLLLSLLRSHHFDVIDLGIVRDEPQSLLDNLLRALGMCDALVTTGGVSMGEKDYFKDVLSHDLQAELHFCRIFMKPGKPTTFSTICNKYTNDRLKLIFSLPGNPVSAFVTSYLFVIPALRKMAGFRTYRPLIVRAQLTHDVTLDSRPEYRRCSFVSVSLPDGQLSYKVSCQEFGNQISSRLASCVAANGLICLPPASDSLRTVLSGTIVSVLQLV